ncbi:phytanoyl-CoA dioxygenase family protein [Streptomyces nogalater]
MRRSWRRRAARSGARARTRCRSTTSPRPGRSTRSCAPSCCTRRSPASPCGWPRALRVYSSDILVKEPKRTLPTLVHDDETGLPLNELSATLTAWIALTDVPVERGCMSYVPGSHLRAREDRQEHMTSFAEFRDLADVWPDYPWQPRVAVPVRAGDVVFHHCRTVHMAEANTSDSVRMAHGVVYMDADATYRPGVQDGHLSRLSPGDPLEGELFPLVTAGTRQ